MEASVGIKSPYKVTIFPIFSSSAQIAIPASVPGWGIGFARTSMDHQTSLFYGAESAVRERRFALLS